MRIEVPAFEVEGHIVPGYVATLLAVGITPRVLQDEPETAKARLKNTPLKSEHLRQLQARWGVKVAEPA